MTACICLLGAAASSGVIMHAAAAATEQGPFVPARTQNVGDGPERLQQDILVTGPKWGDPDIGNLPIEGTIREEEIIQLGSDTVDSLIDDLGPRAGGKGNSPILLINGRHVADKSEVLTLPAEAVERVEVLGERASLTYGAQPGTRVLNVVLKSTFQALSLNASEAVPTEGGFDKAEAKATYSSIAGPTRLTVNLAALRDTPLTEADRNLAPQPFPDKTQVSPGDLDFMRADSSFRTLLPRNRSLKTSIDYTFPLGGLINVSLNASAEFGRSERSLGLVVGTIFAPTFPEAPFVRRYTDALPPRRRDTDARSIRVGAELWGQQGRWTWNTSIAFKRNAIETQSDLAPDFAQFQNAVDLGADPLGPIPPSLLPQVEPYSSQFTITSGNMHFNARGPLATLPAGTAWVQLRGDLTAITASSEISSGMPSHTGLSRKKELFAATWQIPLTSSSSPAFGVGDLTLSAGLELQSVSDFGTLLDKSVALTWRPMPRLSIHGSLSFDQMAPSLTQLSSPRTLTSGVRLIDFLRGENVVATLVRQGDPGLRSQDEDSLGIGFVYQPYSGRRSLSFSAEFTDRMTHNPISFLSATIEMQQAYPDRFSRARDGSIESFDSSPVNFERAEQQSLQFGVHWSWPLGPAKQGPAALPPPRLFGYILDEWILKDRLRLTRDIAVDYLAGDAKGYPGNRPHNRLKGKLGYVQTGFGGEVGFTWQSASVIRNFAAGLTSMPEPLKFSDRWEIDVNAFVDLGRSGLFGTDGGFWRGTRFRFGVRNLFNSRTYAITPSGSTPFLYQGAFLSPAGRTVSLAIRKKF